MARTDAAQRAELAPTLSLVERVRAMLDDEVGHGSPRRRRGDLPLHVRMPELFAAFVDFEGDDGD